MGKGKGIFRQVTFLLTRAMAIFEETELLASGAFAFSQAKCYS